VERATGSDFLGRQVAEPRPGVVTVAFHSVVRQYLAPAERTALEAVLQDAGARATREAPFAHLSLEPQEGQGASFLLALTTWPGGRTTVLADCEGHGPPVVWRPSR
jgi:hypothetical protein